MEAVMVVFTAVGSSTVNIYGTKIGDNSPSNLWTVLAADVSSTGNIANSNITNNENVEYVFSAVTDSVINVENVIVDGAVGGQVLEPSGTSSVGFATLDSEINWDRVEVTNVGNFLVSVV